MNKWEYTTAWGQATFQGGNVSTYGSCGSSGPWTGLHSGSPVDKRCSKQRRESIDEQLSEQATAYSFLSTVLPPLASSILLCSSPNLLFFL
jgi:hypothetical protein